MKSYRTNIVIFGVLVVLVSLTFCSENFLGLQSSTNANSANSFGFRNDSGKNDTEKNDTDKKDDKKNDADKGGKKNDTDKGGKKNDTDKGGKKNDTDKGGKKNDTDKGGKKNDTKKGNKSKGNNTKKSGDVKYDSFPKDNTNVFGKKKKSTNAVGEVGPANFSIAKVPYKIKSCDQVLMVEGSFLNDMDNYCWRTNAFFTLSSYMINVFAKRNSSQLLKSINLNDITDLPQILPGSKSCIEFFDGHNLKNVTMCLKTEKEAKQIETAYMDLMKCKMGLSLDIDWRKMFFEHCLKDHQKFNNLTKIAFGLNETEIREDMDSFDFFGGVGKSLMNKRNKNKPKQNNTRKHLNSTKTYIQWLQTYYRHVPGTD